MADDSGFDPNAFIEQNIERPAAALGAPIQAWAQSRGYDVENLPKNIVDLYNQATVAPTVQRPLSQAEINSQHFAQIQGNQDLQDAEAKLQKQAIVDDAAEKHANAIAVDPMEGYTDVPKPQFAEGGEAFNPDAYLAQQPQAQASAAPAPDATNFDPDAFINDADQSKYGSTGQQIKAGLEGVAKGVAGPLAPLIEHKGFRVPYEDIKGREEANPVTSGIGQGVGLVGGALTGVGEGAAMEAAGKGAAELAGLGHVAEHAETAANLVKQGLSKTEAAEFMGDIGLKAPTYAAKVGSSAVQQAAEMAVLQGSDEASKSIINDVPGSAENAIANIGLAAALGGAGGAFITGAVSPLWQATAGPKLEQLLGGVKGWLNGANKLALPEEREAAAQTLGMTLDPLQRAATTDDFAVRSMAGDLRRGERQEMLEAIDQLHQKASTSVMDSLGINEGMIHDYSSNVAGQDLKDTVKEEIQKLYDPAHKAMEQRTIESAPIKIGDENRLQARVRLAESAISDSNIGVHSDHYPLVGKWGDRLLNAESVGDLDALKTQLSNDIKMAARAGDDNKRYVLNKIKQQFGALQEDAIEAAAPKTAGLMERRKAQNAAYAQYAQKMDALSDHLGIGDFRGTGKLLSKLVEDKSPEELLRKMSIKGNSDLIPFLKENLPATYAKILENERKEMIKPAVLAAAKKGENPIDINKLSDIVNRARAGRKEYVDAVLPAEAIKRIDAAKTLTSGIVSPRDSGTPAGISKIFKHMLPSAVGAVSWATGHGPLGGLMVGEAAQYMGKSMPEGVKLAYLRFLSSDQPVKAEGFKAMVEFMHNAVKGETMMNTAVKNVMKSGSQVLTDKQMPDPADRQKLDKVIEKYQENPEVLMKIANSHVGHYLPDQQAHLAQATTAQVQYLQALKPQPHQSGPLNKPIEPLPAQIARYNRALDIANQPAVILQHMKDGTLKTTDLQDLKALYPNLYTSMAQKVTNAMTEKHSDEELIPYKTRMGISLFLAQPIDSSMSPMSIQAAQPMPKQPPQQPNKPMAGRKGKTAIDKVGNQYKTPGQAAEGDRSNRD